MAKQKRLHLYISPHTDISLPVDMDITTTTKIALSDSTSSATHVAFHKFIELADLNTIKIFITTASSSPEGENLKLLWARVFKEGLMAGHQLYGKMEEKLKEVHIHGYEEGYQAGYNEGWCDKQKDWLMDGLDTVFSSILCILVKIPAPKWTSLQLPPLSAPKQHPK